MESRIELVDRWRREGREDEAAKYREQVRSTCREQGMSRKDANEHAWAAAAEAFTPMGTEEASSNEQGVHGRITGLQTIPDSWPELPSNVSLGSELSWVQSNRLRVVEETPSGATRVQLGRAREPAPSWAALGWLETSIRAYAKFVDVAAKATATQQDEQELVRRERMQIDEIRGLLDEMNEQIAADMLADASATVRERVRSVVPDWCRQCGIDESRRQWLEGHVCELAMDLLKAAGVEVETDAGQDADTDDDT